MRVNTLTLPIRWADIDSFQHVGHQRYLDWMMEIRIQWLKDLAERSAIDLLYRLVVVDIQCNYQQSLFYPGSVTLTQDLLALGNSSLSLGYQFWLNAECTNLVATGSVKLVHIDPLSKKSMPLPSALRDCYF